MGREQTVYGVTAGKWFIPTGASLAQFVDAAPGEIASVVKFAAGGSLEIIGCAGAGLTGVPVAGNGYLVTLGEVQNISGAARYYLLATGATATVYFWKGLSQGN